ncbi:MAG: hypothetical protein LBC43_00295 [Bifidobacteriaceae bacterium]|jgi:hypothetical protein|nr:hypothetical protein [Bifidobacteriaceae bacterium]
MTSSKSIPKLFLSGLTALIFAFSTLISPELERGILSLGNSLKSAVAAPRDCTSDLNNISGSGSDIDPYIIAGADDLNCMRQAVNEGLESIISKTWKVINDIDLSAISAHYEDQGGWIPIGSKDKFVGVFYGAKVGSPNGEVNITGVVITGKKSSVGLFGYV